MEIDVLGEAAFGIEFNVQQGKQARVSLRSPGKSMSHKCRKPLQYTLVYYIIMKPLLSTPHVASEFLSTSYTDISRIYYIHAFRRPPSLHVSIIQGGLRVPPLMSTCPGCRACRASWRKCSLRKHEGEVSFGPAFSSLSTLAKAWGHWQNRSAAACRGPTTRQSLTRCAT